jgi:hypothetical protein
LCCDFYVSLCLNIHCPSVDIHCRSVEIVIVKILKFKTLKLSSVIPPNAFAL